MIKFPSQCSLPFAFTLCIIAVSVCSVSCFPPHVFWWYYHLLVFLSVRDHFRKAELLVVCTTFRSVNRDYRWEFRYRLSHKIVLYSASTTSSRSLFAEISHYSTGLFVRLANKRFEFYLSSLDRSGSSLGGSVFVRFYAICNDLAESV